MAVIRCGNCGGEHGSVAEVRACHAGAPVAPAAAAAPVVAVASDNAAGPEALGRWLVVSPGQAAPTPWEDAARITVTTLNDETVERLESAWLARRRTVIEWALPSDAPPAPAEHRLPWGLDPTFTFVDERAWHLVWSNSVDGRHGDLRWPWARRPEGDIWFDGGPLTRPPAELSVVHRIAVERGISTPLGTGACTADLAPDQLAAVTHPGSTARIIAPAGSGKTRVLTERARHLLHDWQIPTSALTLVAFNVRAADEMRQRTTDLPGLNVRTLNSLALSIVKASRRVDTIDEREVRRIIDSLVTLPRKANTDPTAAWIDAFSFVRLGLRDPTEVEAMFDGDVPGFAEVFPRYRAALASRNVVDFDEQITAAIVILLTDPVARATAQRSCRVLLVDEFQDLAPAHLLLLRLLASPDLAVFGVGDDDQTIYGYAGATPEWLIRFDRLFPGAGDHPLEVNYRCPPAVVSAAATLLTHNRRRVAKTIRAPEIRLDEPGALTIVFDDNAVTATVSAVQAALARGAAPAEVAVLTRVTASLAPIQVALRHHGIAATAPIDAGYLERSGVRAALAWLRIANDPERIKGSDIELTARRPSRGLSAKVVEWMAGTKGRAGMIGLAERLKSERDSDKVYAYVSDVTLLAEAARRRATTAELLRHVRDQVGLDEALAKLDRSRADTQSTHLDDLDALVGLAGLHPEAATFAEWLHTELSAPGDARGVMLASIHRVKGREWPHVVVHDVRDGVVPHRLADDHQEERRVFHVAITRCSQTVTIVGDPQRRSPFLDELTSVATAESLAVERPRPAGSVADAPSSPLRDALREWRGARAKADNVPAYVVFTNVTLDALAEMRPTSLDELRKIPGIGPAKRDRYGADIVGVIAASV